MPISCSLTLPACRKDEFDGNSVLSRCSTLLPVEQVHHSISWTLVCTAAVLRSCVATAGVRVRLLANCLQQSTSRASYFC
eukprot:5921239-Amphidinium_carterae.1